MTITLKWLSEQAVLITGARSGIGAARARAAAVRGAKPVLAARDGEALQRAIDDILHVGGSVDVGDARQVAAAAEQALHRNGRIDTGVNDAGAGIVAKFVETALAERDDVFRIDHAGTMNGATVAVRHLREQARAPITVASRRD